MNLAAEPTETESTRLKETAKRLGVDPTYRRLA